MEPLALDEAYLDVTDARGPGTGGADLARQIKQVIWGEVALTAWAGVGPLKCVAKIASARCKPNGLLEVQEDRVLKFLHPLPVSAL